MKLDIQIDPTFTGTLQDSPSQQGTTRLDGVCHLEIDKPMKTKGLMVQFIGILKIDVRRGITLKADVSDAIERRLLVDERLYLEGDGSYNSVIPAGSHQYPFTFHIPISLPPSFQTDRGNISYSLRATAQRTLLSDTTAEKPVSLRKCMTRGLSSLLNSREHIEGYQDGLAFAMSTPSIVFREGGQLKLAFSLSLPDVRNCKIKSIDCGLKESIIYRTSGSQSLHRETRQVSDTSFPLGMQNIDCYNSHHTPRCYDVDLRLIPKIHTDMSTKLLKVRHYVHLLVSAERWDSRSSRNVTFTKRYKIEVPVIVSSKESFWDGQMPPPPAYSRYEMPPCYVESLTQLPPAPPYKSQEAEPTELVNVNVHN
ncbi:hypothetical protein K450DRAFT_281173 [Umbelopsis ramanniana AG]|uniref:Arrestin-like N-terminal domain-containing protein n=1 Tax=Umbelopsis ramanniana AG TaxID=1314678 RepID=A0AAD5EA24_UMBRA|nr:uncharacterized protein K450DRAFT_281173 [Umbelopsis ramanniana AG]KAI8579110.1 hypothetical protein K450DRAFT_281173 [Umbelopsis ramanniana AG]